MLALATKPDLPPPSKPLVSVNAVQKTYFAVREVPDALVAKLNDLRQSFAGTELRDCSADEKRAAK